MLYHNKRSTPFPSLPIIIYFKIMRLDHDLIVYKTSPFITT